MTTFSETNSVCCPEFNPALWDDKLLEWKNKKFIKERVFTLFYMPVNFGSVMKRFDKVVKQAGSKMPSDGFCLAEHTSLWNMYLYLAAEKEIPGTENTLLSGKYYFKVYEGPFSDTEKWHKDYEHVLMAKKLKKSKLFMWYTTCPKCAKKYGKNYVAIVSQVE